jgi:uncharacterized protein (DUF983 family)
MSWGYLAQSWFYSGAVARSTSPTPAASPGLSPVVMFARGVTKRCARCGSRRLFTRWFTMKKECPGCGLRFEREEGFFLGAITMNIAVMMIAAGLVIIVGFSTRRPGGSIVPMLAAGLASTVILPCIVYPFSKTLWLAVDLTMRRSMGEQFSGDGTQPGFRPKP